MADVRPATAGSVAAELLAFYREPVAHRPGYLHGERPMPDGGVVLRFALGRFPQGWVRDLPAPDREELRVAALAFVRQVCLWERATHYQVLCLGRGAARETVRENYHLLIALLHPDRQDFSSEGWPAGYAQRVNRAHEILVDPAARAEYDASVRTAADGAAFGTPAAWHGSFARSSGTRSGASLGLARGFLLVIALLATLFVVQAWWAAEFSPQHGLLERSLPASARWVREALPDAPRFLTGGSLFDPPERMEPLKEPGRLAVLASPVPIANSKRPDPPVTAAPPAAPPVVQPNEPAVPLQRAAQAEPPPAAALAESPAVVASAVPAQPAPVRVAQAPAVAPSSGPSRDQVENLVASLVSSYESGDAESLMNLFDPDALGWIRGYQVRSGYADFFAATRTRRLRMERLSWQNGGEGAQARGEATVLAEYADGRPRLERRVPVELDIALRGGQARLTRLVLFPTAQ